MSHTITFTTGENNILGTSVKYWKVGEHGMSMSALVTTALCIYFPIPGVFYNNFK